MADQESEFEQGSESILPIDEHEEIVSEGGKKIRRRGIYLLPNLLTLSALFAGFYAIISGMSGNFNEAGWAIFIAGICDGLDGRIARLTNTQSAFGAQFDSISDMVSFGVAPALIMFSWGFGPLDRVGWAASFIYVSCAAIRLARFNVQLGTVDKRFFVGLQSPLGAAVVTFVPWVAHRYGLEVTPLIAYLAAILTVFVGLLMISNYKYFSFKELNFKGTVPFMVFIFAVVMLVLVAQNPHEMLLLMALIYGCSGPLTWLYKGRQPAAGFQKTASSREKSEASPSAAAKKPKNQGQASKRIKSSAASKTKPATKTKPSGKTKAASKIKADESADTAKVSAAAKPGEQKPE